MLFAGLRVLSIVKVSRSTCAAIPVLRGRGRQYSLVTDSTDFVEPRRTGLRAASGLVGSRGASFAYGVRTSSACFQLLPSRARGNGVDSTGFVGAVRGLKFSGSTGKAKVWLCCFGDQIAHTSRAFITAQGLACRVGHTIRVNVRFLYTGDAPGCSFQSVQGCDFFCCLAQRTSFIAFCCLKGSLRAKLTVVILFGVPVAHELRSGRAGCFEETARVVAVVVFEGSFWTSLAGAIGLRGAVVLQSKARRAGGAIVGACICGCIDGLEFSCNTSRAGVILGGRAVRLKLRSFVTGSAPSGACCTGSRGLEGSGGAGFALDIVRGVPCACLQLFPSRTLCPVRKACAEPAACTTVGICRTDGAHGIGGGQRGRVVVPSRTETPRRTLRGGSGAVGLRWTGIAGGCASTQ
jgi:hypothetical protein